MAKAVFSRKALVRWLRKHGNVRLESERDIIVDIPQDKLRSVIISLSKRTDGFRSVALNAYFDKDGSFNLLYHFSNPHVMLTLKSKMSSKPEQLESITPFFPEADAFEREFSEMFGVRIIEPESKSEKEGLLLYDLKQPFHQPKKEKEKEIITSKSSRASCLIPIGPQHPALLEPENFILEVEDEIVLNARVNLGYVHRGIEKLAEQKNYLQNIFLIERICGICSGVHTVCYTQCLEKAAGIIPPRRAEYIRTLVLELERLHSHMLWLGIFAYEMGQDTLFHCIFRDREAVLDRLEEISGNRINYGMSTIGGVRRDVTSTALERIVQTAREIKRKAEEYLEIFSSDRAIVSRCENVGKIKKNTAARFATGPCLRACSSTFDVRTDGYAAYDELGFSVVKEDGCDVLAMVLVRIKEMVESCNLLEEAAERMPTGNIKDMTRVSLVLKDVEQTHRVEAPRGELFYFIKGNGSDKPHRIKVRTPTLANFQLLPHMLIGQQLADVPVIIASIDPCFSCCERALVKDIKTQEKRVLTFNDLRRMGR